jgi:hypothetical protein
MTTATPLQQSAKAFASAFEHKRRYDGDGDDYVALKDGSPEWMKDAIRAAHDNGDILPNDWIYRACERIADEYAESCESEDTDDLAMIMAERLTDVYTSDLLAWLQALGTHAVAYIDSAREDGLTAPNATFMDLVSVGQYAQLRYIGDVIVMAVQDNMPEVTA